MERNEHIKQLLEKNGPMGVNALSRETGINLSTLQKYLERQTYFVKNASRKWELPNDKAPFTQTAPNTNIATIIDNNLNNINALADALMSQLQATTALMQSVPTALPVADDHICEVKEVKVEKELHNRIKVIYDLSIDIPKAVKQQKSVTNPDLHDLLKDVDFAYLICAKGVEWFNEYRDQLTAALLGKRDNLDERLVKALNFYTKDKA